MKKVNNLFILLAFLVVCFMPIRVHALAQLDDKLYDSLFYNASANTSNTGAVLIYRGWNANVGYNTEMIKAIPHLNVINLTGQTLQFTKATGCFAYPNIVGQVALMRENTADQKFAFSFDLVGVSSDDNNTNPGPKGTNRGDSQWTDAIKKKGTSDLTMSVGRDSFTLHLDSTDRYNGLAAAHADLVTMSLHDTNSKKYASYIVNNKIVNRGMVYLTGYSDASGRPYEVFLVAGDRTNITFLVKYKNS